ncbi:MAG: hypothetical protein Q8O22_00550 [Candidatus Omnitrophota bacterium]|nr:hypothetical protein [Candidatus Omnitrophota bacterium]
MKKTVLAVIVLTFVPSLCFATNFAKTKKAETVKATTNTVTTPAPEEKTTVVKAEAPVLSEETTAETKIETQSLDSLLEIKTPEVAVETKPVSEVKTPQAKVETKPVVDTKVTQAKVETKPAPVIKTPEAKVVAKPVEKKAPQVKTPAFKDEAKSKEKTPVKADVRSYTGKIDSVALGDVATGIQPIIVAVDDNGERIPFIIKAKTAITDKGKEIKLTEVKKDSKVVVEYTVKPVEGFTAQSIKLQ